MLCRYTFRNSNIYSVRFVHIEHWTLNIAQLSVIIVCCCLIFFFSKFSRNGKNFLFREKIVVALFSISFSRTHTFRLGSFCFHSIHSFMIMTETELKYIEKCQQTLTRHVLCVHMRRWNVNSLRSNWVISKHAKNCSNSLTFHFYSRGPMSSLPFSSSFFSFSFRLFFLLFSSFRYSTNF